MEIFTLVIMLAVFAETSFLTINKYKPAKSGRRKIYIDTSALIDGRILDIAKTGFVDGDLIIPKSVLLELQLIADGKDSEKRARARMGLEVAAELERVPQVNTDILDDGDLGRKKVDEELLKTAKSNKGTILTLDYNLIKVAEAEKIPTLNINDLALAVRLSFTIGEKAKIKVVEKGSMYGQGVGYLGNGTMVVIEKAANKIGKEVLVEFTNIHETSSGKMMFAKIVQR
ncbi:hypothetical protein IIY66_03095 [Candidatus Saccharibacteria bacterium]|nr:hypothetical protein [Candidatus Saccharibacteria bacterium]